MDFELSPDHKVLQSSVRDFVEKEVKPLAIQIDENHAIPDELVKKMGGMGLLASVRSDPDLSRLPTIFITAKDDRATMRQGMAAGADDYLTKPFHLDEFLLRVRAILRRWQWYKTSLAPRDAAGCGAIPGSGALPPRLPHR